MYFFLHDTPHWKYCSWVRHRARKMYNNNVYGYTVVYEICLRYQPHRAVRILRRAVSVPWAPHPWRASTTDLRNPTAVGRRSPRQKASPSGYPWCWPWPVVRNGRRVCSETWPTVTKKKKTKKYVWEFGWL